MTIIIQASGRMLDLPSDIKLNIELTSPILSASGSMSLPISLPFTDNNRRILNFPDRLDIYDSIEQAIRAIPETLVIVTHGSWQKRATLSISACSEKTIEVTLYFNESNLWSLLEDLTLPQVMAGIHYGDIPPTENDIDTYRQQLFNALNTDIQNYNYTIDHREEALTQGHITYNQWKQMYESRAEWLKTREFVVAPVYTEDGWLNQMVERNYRLLLKSTTSYLYISIFLRLDYVLHKIFEKIGKTLTIDFSGMRNSTVSSFQEEQWHSVFILNNTMDALYPGCIYYDTLVPEMACKDFLKAVMSQFGCAFADQPDGSVKMFFTYNILASNTHHAVGMYRDKQIAFNTLPEYDPQSGMDSSDYANTELHDMPSLEHSNYWYSDREAIDDYPNLRTATLDGLRQRTSITTTDGEDTTESKKCPLVFVCYESSFVNYDDDRGTVIFHYPCLRKAYIEYYGSRIESQLTYIENIIKRLYFKETTEKSFYEHSNSSYVELFSKCDKVTITKTMSIRDLMNFDFNTAFIIQGRSCWPAKLQYELQNSDMQHVTIELYAPR
jgi:hypothetical protein